MLKTIAILLFIIPTLSSAFGITAFILYKKHKLGDPFPVEFTNHDCQLIAEYKCNEKDIYNY